MFSKIKEKFGEWFWMFKRFFFTVKVDVKVVSPHYPGNARVYMTIFKRKDVEVDFFKVPISELGLLDMKTIQENAPVIHMIKLNYPDNWTRYRGLFMDD